MMKDVNEIFGEIDKLIDNINQYKVEPIFSNEIQLRNNRKVSENLTENEIIELFATLIAFSQNANSELVKKIIDTGIFREIFANFDIDEMVKMNPCDLADKYWSRISGIRQQAKLFHIISLARKIKSMGSFSSLLKETHIPKKIKNESDIVQFWIGFHKLKKVMVKHKVPFFRSTISLLHLLLEMGYDCVKPDLVVMKVSKKIGIIDSENGEKNFIKTVEMIQRYCIEKGIRPSIIDLYFLIDEGQLASKKFVNANFYKQKY